MLQNTFLKIDYIRDVAVERDNEAVDQDVCARDAPI